MKWMKPLLLAACAWIFAATAAAQSLVIKNNVLYDATLTPNLSVEVGLSAKWILDTQVGANYFLYNTDPQSAGYDTRKFSHILVEPELRYWLCERFAGWFVGAHLVGGAMNVGGINIPFILQNKNRIMEKHRYEGWFAGAGVGIGYQYPLSKHWSVEAELGLGYVYVHYDKFGCQSCGKRMGSGRADYLGPTKAALSLAYVF